MSDHGHSSHDHPSGLNIALISSAMPPMMCGVGDNALALARTLVQRGHRVTIYTHLEAEELVEDGLHVRPMVGTWNWAGCHALVQQLILDDPDLVQIEYPGRAFGSQTGPVNLPLFLKLRKFKGPVVVRLHEWQQAHWLRRLASWPLLNDADGVCVPTEVIREGLLFTHRSLKDRPAAVIPVGPVVPPDGVPAATQEQWAAQLLAWGVPADAFPLLLSFGFVRRDKGLESLAAAIAELKKTTQVHVLHLGPFEPASDPQQEAVLEAISQYQIIDRMHFVGAQSLSLLPATPPLGVAAVFPYVDGISDRRSAAITLGSLGYPVLTTESADDATNEHWRGLATLVPSQESAALAGAIRQLTAADGWPAGNAAGYAARFDWEALGAAWEAFYEDVFARYRVLVDPGYYPASQADLAAHHDGGHH
ncbi:MAG: hypothetical protein GEEBNDBF_01426 [bacterium]|nr:hypothetical protein [bacterium]